MQHSLKLFCKSSRPLSAIYIVDKYIIIKNVVIFTKYIIRVRNIISRFHSSLKLIKLIECQEPCKSLHVHFPMSPVECSPQRRTPLLNYSRTHWSYSQSSFHKGQKRIQVARTTEKLQRNRLLGTFNNVKSKFLDFTFLCFKIESILITYYVEFSITDLTSRVLLYKPVQRFNNNLMNIQQN